MVHVTLKGKKNPHTRMLSKHHQMCTFCEEYDCYVYIVLQVTPEIHKIYNRHDAAAENGCFLIQDG